MEQITAEQAQTWSATFLTAHEIPQNPRLPLIEEPSELQPPDAARVARRTIVLCNMIGVGYGVECEDVARRLREHGLWDDATPMERALLEAPSLSQQDLVNATWLTECVQVLAWGLGLVELDHFRRCDDDLASHFPAPSDSPAAFIEGAKLRAFEDIYLQCDLLYRLHWGARNAQLGGAPCKGDASVTLERHRAIQWLAGVEANWDDVSTDT